MTKKKRLLTVFLAAVTAVCLALGVYFLFSGNLFVLADDSATGEHLTMQKLDANSEYLIGSYIDAYGVPASAIKNSDTNGDAGSGSLSNVLDRNFGTAWRSKASISDTSASITATFYFKDVYNLEGFLYQAESSGRGYFTDLEVSYHGAKDYDNSEFHHFGSIKSNATGSTVYIKFDKPTEMTAIRLEWKDAPMHSGVKNASAAEIVFLQPEDKDVESALGLFSDYAQLKLKDDVNEDTVKAVRESLQSKSTKLASWESFLDPLLNRASQIYNKALSLDPRREMGTAPDSTNLLGRHGDVAGYARNTLKFSNFGTNRQATGVSARPGDVLTIYVEADEDDPLPSLVFSQHWGTAMLNWKSGNYSLRRGRNIIVTPSLQYYGCHDNNGEAVPSGGPIYLVNPYLPKEEDRPDGRTEPQQSANVKIYIEGGTAIPTFRKGGDVDAYLSDLADYAELVEQDKIDNGDTLNYTVVDVTEVVCDRMTLTVQATRGNYYYNELGYDPQEACENWDDYVKKLLMYDGVVFLEKGETVGSPEFEEKLKSVYGKYDSRNEWLSVNVRLMQPWGAAYAAPEHVGIQVGWDGSGLIGQGWGWGYSHEIGHMLDISERLVGECSNNMISKFDETVLEKIASRGDFAQNLAQLSPDEHMDSYFNTNRLNFTIWWLIESYFPGYWTKLENYYRYYNLYEIVKDERKSDESINATEKQIFLSSIVTGIDLSYYFERWGYNLSGGNPIFTYEDSSPLFKRMMTLGKEKGYFSNELQPKLWYLDAAEWWERYDGKSYAANPSFDEGFDKGALYTEEMKAPSILNINQSGKSYSLMIGLDEENFGKPEHLGYEVQVKETVDGKETWKVVGFTYGRMFSDPHEYAAPPTYRLVAYDRALHHSAPGDANTRDSEAITEVCKIENTGTVYNSVAEAVAAAKDNDTIILLKDSYESGILIDKALTIKSDETSAKKFRITKCGSEPIFKVVEQSFTVETEEGSNEFREENHFGKLTLIGIVLDGFKIESDGSLVLVEAGDLTVEDCIFQDGMYKYGNDSMGGALHFKGTKLTVKNTVFSGNSARLGGAVCVTHRVGSDINFEGCTFRGNTAREGGGLYNTGTVHLTECTFEENTAESVGGGFANVSGGVMYVHGCTFTKNRTDGKGGGFYADGMVELYGGSFTENEAKTDGAAFCYWRSSGAARPFYAKPCDLTENHGQLPEISGNISEEGSAVTLHGQVEHFEANILENSTKFAVRLGGAAVNLDGGTIHGAVFREISGKVNLNAESIFQNESGIVVYTDSQEAHLVILSAGANVTLGEEYAKKFVGENNETPKYDAERREISIELDSYTVTFNIKIDENKTETEIRHYRPGSSFTFESFTGNKDQKWYVTEWREGEETVHKIGEKFDVTGDVIFDAVVSEKFRIEFKVDETYNGAQSQTFYAMPGEKYTLPKFDIEGYAHNGWELETVDASGKTVTKTYQPAKSFRASEARTYRAVIVKKFTVQYMVEGKEGRPSLYFATRSVAYGSKLTWESCNDEDYVPFGGFIEGYYIRNSDGTHSENLVDFNTYTVTSDLVLVAKVIEETSMICYMVYDDGLTETGGHFIGDGVFSYIAYDTDYTLDLLPIPEGYHLTSLVFNGQTLDPKAADGYTFKVEDYSYLVVAYVERNTYTISYECNEVPFRTETVLYGSTLTFTDPTNSLLKEAVRGYEDLDENSKYSFTSYQLISANPRAGEDGEPEKIRLNIMLGDQITVTENLTVNIIAYIEGHAYEADESAGNTVEEWRMENRTEINDLLKSVTDQISAPTLTLSVEERAKYTGNVNAAANVATETINKTVSFEEMRAARQQFEEEANKILAEALARAAKNAAKNAVASAMQDALRAFDGMADEEGSTVIQEAREEIGKIGKEAQDTIEATVEADYQRFVDDALERMQNVVIECKGDRLALKKGNAVTNATGFADNAKRKIEALRYLSSGMKSEFAERIDASLKETVEKINAVEPKSSTEEALAEAIQEINGQVISFELYMEGIVYLQAEGYNNSKLGVVKDGPDEPDRCNDLMDHAAKVTEEIKALLQASTEEIRADGIILSNEELIAKLTAFADEKVTSVASILSAALSEITEIPEDEDNGYLTEVESAVREAKAKIDAEKAEAESDFAAKIKEAEQGSRDDIISRYVTALAESTRQRFGELTLADRETYESRLKEAEESVVETVQTAENIKEIKAAVTSFYGEVANLRMDAETASAQAVIESTVTNSGSTLKGYDFLEAEWIQTYTKSIADAAAAAREQIGTAAKAEDVISIVDTFSAAVQKTLGEANVRNGTKGAEAKTAALEKIDSFANETYSEIDALGFLSGEQKSAAKGNVKTAAEAARKNVSEATSKHDMEAQREAFTESIEGADGILTEAKALNDSTATEVKGTAISKAERAAASLKGEIDALRYLTEEDRTEFNGSAESKLQTAISGIQAALTVSGVEEAEATFEHDLNAIRARATETDNAIRGDRLAKAMSDAIDVVTKKIDEIRARTAALAFLTEETRKPFSDRLNDALRTATLGIRAATDETEIPALQQEHLEIAEQIGTDAAAKNEEAKLQIAADGNKTLDEAANIAIAAIEALTDLTDAEKSAFTNQIEAAKATAAAKIAAAATPAAIETAVKEGKAEIEAETAKAKADDALAQVKRGAQETLSKQHAATEEIGALGFLTEQEKSDYCGQVADAVTTAEEAIGRASAADDVDRALSAFTAQTDSVRSAAAQKNGENETAFKTAKKDLTSEAAKAFYDVINAQDYISQEEKDIYTLRITALVQETKDKITAAGDLGAIDAAFAEFESALEEFEGVLGEANKESRQASTQNALAAVGSAAENAKNSVNGLKGKFLSEAEIEQFLQEIENTAASARQAIENAKTVEAVDEALASCVAAMQKTAADAAEANAEHEAAAKNRQDELSRKYNAAKSTLSGLTFLTEEEQNAFDKELQDAVMLASTHIFDAENQSAIESELATLDGAIKDINAKAALRNAKNDKLAQAEKAAEAAENAVNALDALSSERKEAYRGNIAAELASVAAAIENAETANAAAEALQKFISSLASIAQGAEKDASDSALAAKKTEAHTSAAKQGENAKQAIDALESLDETAKEGFKTEIDGHVAAANTAVAGATDGDGVLSALDALQSSLASVTEKAVAANAERKAELDRAEEDRLAKLHELKEELLTSVAAKAAAEKERSFAFLGEEDIKAYVSAIETALGDARTAIQAAQTEEEARGAKAAFDEAVLAAQNAALSKNAENKQAAKDEAEKRVTTMVIEAKQTLDGHGFITLMSYRDEIDVAADSARTEIRNAEQQTDIDRAVETLKNKIDEIQTSAAADNFAATVTAKSVGKGEVSDRSEKIKDSLAALGFVSADDYQTEIEDAVSAANTAVDGAKDNREIGLAVSGLIEEFDDILKRATQVNDSNKAEAVEAALQEIGDKAENAKQAVEALVFLHEKGTYLEAIGAAAEKGEESLRAAQSSAALDSAKTEILNAISAEQEKAEKADLDTKTAEVNAAKDTVAEETEKANGEIGALGFVSAENYNVDEYATEANAAIDSAEDRDHIQNALAELKDRLKDVKDAATADNEKARATAVSEGKSQAETQRAGAENGLEVLGFIDAESYGAQIDTAAANASDAIDTAAQPSEIFSALQMLTDALAEIAAQANAANELAKRSAVNTALREIETAKGEAETAISALRLLTDKTSYTDRITAAAEKAKAQLEDPANTAAVNAAKAEALAEFDDITSDAQAAHGQVLQEIETAIEAAMKTLSELKDRIEKAIGALGFLRGGSSVALMSLDETTKESFLAELEAAYNAALEGFNADNFTDGAGVVSYLEKVSAALENIQTDAEKVNQNNKTFVMDEAKAEIGRAKEEIEALLKNPDLPAEKKAEYEAELRAVVSDAEAAMEHADSLGAVEGLRTKFQNGADLLKEMIQNAPIEDATVQIVVEGIRATGREYNGTDSIQFDLTGVIYRNALTGEEIPSEFTGDFKLTVSGRLSDYNAGKQIALITSITLESSFIESGEFALAPEGQQAFAEVEIAKTRLVVRAHGDGSVTYEGFVNGEDESVLTGELVVERNGNVLTPRGLESVNYEIVFVSETAEAAPAALWLGIAAACLSLAAACMVFAAVRRKKQ